MENKISMFVAKNNSSNIVYANDWDNAPGEFIDEVDVYIRMIDLNIFVARGELSDSQEAAIYAGREDRLTKVATVNSWLLLCEQMLYDGDDPYEICDDESADFGYAISALSEPGAPLNEVDGDPHNNVLYIHEIMGTDGKIDQLLLERIIDELPYIVWEQTGIKAEVLAYYPVPLEYDRQSTDEAKREYEVNRIIVDRLDDMYSGITGNKAEKKPEEMPADNVKKLPVDYQLDEDDLRRFRGERVPGSTGYPMEYANKELIKQYTDCGFSEAGQSRLLYKNTDFSITFD